MKICIDPGHGGADSGAVGPGGTREKDVNLAVAKLLFKYLDPVADVKLTRSDDRRLGNNENSDLAERVRIAEAWRANYFISLHCNAAAAGARGVETYAYKPGGEGERLARAIQKELVEATGFPDRGVKFANYYVLRKTSMPAVLIELAFISNPDEEKLLKDPAWQDRAALAIAQGIAKYFGKELKGGAQKVAEVPAWMIQVVKEAEDVGIITKNVHKPEEIPNKAFVLAVVLNAMKKLKEG